MKTIDIARRAGRNLKRAKMRTFLTSVAIAVGGFAIMASLMAGEGARQYVDRVISANMDPKSIMISRDASSFSAQGPSNELQEYDPNKINMYGTDMKALTMDDIEALRARDDIRNVEPYFMLNPKYVEFSVQPDKKYLARVDMRDSSLSMATAAGQTINAGTELSADQAIVPDGYLEKLGVTHANDIVGKTVIVTVEQAVQQPDEKKLMETYASGGETAVKQLMQAKELKKAFTIVAVSKKTAEQAVSSGAPIYISQASAKELVDFSTIGTDAYQKYLGAYGLVAGDHDPQKVKEALERDGYGAMTAKDMQSMIFTFVNILQSIVLGFGALALIVSIFGIVNTMYISVLERTQQIGLMKALGASRRDIGRLFRYEAAWVGFLGGVIGVLTSWGVGAAVNPLISAKLSLGEHSLLIFQPIAALAVVALLMLVAVIAGWLPSNKAAKLDPIEALRTE